MPSEIKSPPAGFVTHPPDPIAIAQGAIVDATASLDGLGHHIRVFGNEQPKRGETYRIHAIVADWGLEEASPANQPWVEVSFIKGDVRTVLVKDEMYSQQNDAQDNNGTAFYYDIVLPTDTSIASLQITVTTVPTELKIASLTEWLLAVTVSTVKVPFAEVLKVMPQIDTMHLTLDVATPRLDILGMVMKGLLQFK